MGLAYIGTLWKTKEDAIRDCKEKSFKLKAKFVIAEIKDGFLVLSEKQSEA